MYIRQELTTFRSCAGLACEFEFLAPRRNTADKYISWSLVFHWVLAITNSSNWLRYVTRLHCDVFGFYVAVIYLQMGVQVLLRLEEGSSFYLSIMASLLVFLVAYIFSAVGTSSLFIHHIRVFIKDYGTPLALIFFTGFVHIGRMRNVELETLPTGSAFHPTAERDWLVRFWTLSVSEIFLAVPFAILLTILFWFDHNGRWNTGLKTPTLLFEDTSLTMPQSPPSSPKERSSP